MRDILQFQQLTNKLHIFCNTYSKVTDIAPYEHDIY